MYRDSENWLPFRTTVRSDRLKKETGLELLDRGYLNTLTERAKEGSSDAFAELFAATSERIFALLVALSKDREKSKEALYRVYERILAEPKRIGSGDTFLPGMVKDARYELQKEESFVPAGLPVSEQQVVLMTEDGFSDSFIRDVLNLSRTEIRRIRRSALARFEKNTGGLTLPKMNGSGKHTPAKVSLAEREAVQILEDVFAAAGKEANTVPLGELSSYAIYRRERFLLQKAVLAAGLTLFALLPLFFILPGIRVTGRGEGTRGLPVYELETSAILPVRAVTARLRTHALPVYEADKGIYEIEPTRNGAMTVRVELMNRQSSELTVTVEDVDSNCPELLGSEVGENDFTLSFRDEGIGTDLREIYAVDIEGNVHYPESIDQENGLAVFAYPESDWDIYVPDHIGNTLHMKLTLDA